MLVGFTFYCLLFILENEVLLRNIFWIKRLLLRIAFDAMKLLLLRGSYHNDAVAWFWFEVWFLEVLWTDEWNEMEHYVPNMYQIERITFTVLFTKHRLENIMFLDGFVLKKNIMMIFNLSHVDRGYIYKKNKVNKMKMFKIAREVVWPK